MTKPYKKKLIEVAIPLEAINAASAREKSIRHGHPSTLHLWWARRPLAACRAVLFAQLVDDPSSLPDQFPTAELQDAERKRLFAIIEELVIWENSTNEEVLERARVEIRRSCGGVLPPVYDPFSGGGSIPLEAQRLGLPAYGSDLNPVAVMIGKAMIEIPPKFKDQGPIHPGANGRIHYRNAEGLAEDIKYYGEWMRNKAIERIGHLYPEVNLPKSYGGGTATAIAYIWARTVPSPDPSLKGLPVPLVKSFDLCTKPGKEAWIEPIIDGDSYHFEIRSLQRGDKTNSHDGTVGRQGGHCIVSGAAMPLNYIRKNGIDGKLGEKLMAIVVDGPNGRIYLPPNSMEQFEIPRPQSAHLEFEIDHWQGCTNCVVYGMTKFVDLYSNRQLLALNTFSEIIEELRDKVLQDAINIGKNTDLSEEYARAIVVYMAFALDKCSDYWSSLCSWHSSGEKMRNTFGRQALPMVWDFTEANPFSSSTGNWMAMVDWVQKAVSNLVPNSIGIEIQHDAQSVEYTKDMVISTDPPYYDNIPYSNLSDFFYLWLRKSLRSIIPELFSTISVPRGEELVANQFRFGGRSSAEKRFMDGMGVAIRRMAEMSSDEFPATIYYAFKQSEIAEEGITSTGWATFLQATIEAGYSVVGTWPMRTEMAARMRATGSNALANSVVLVCRKKESSAETITRAEFIRALKRELPSAIKELQAANIAPADMPQSAIGPGMGVFSRYRAVLESDDSPMSVKAALQLINRELDDYLGGIQGEFDADTRFAITWFEQNGLKAGDYGTANNIATARGISVESVKHAGIVESQAGKVRVLRRDELDDKWEPGTDQHLTIWECLQHLVRLHEKDGISQATSVLLKKIGDKAEAVKDLAYILYDISANKRQDAKEATAYNALIADWTELSRQAAAIYDTRGDLQQRLDL
jgi:putative DNA methylase